MKVFCIRHTSVEIPAGVCYGQTDVGLKETYEKEKNTIVANLGDKEFDLVFSSSLSRCQKLAKDMFPDQKIIYDVRLKELDFGKWELNTWDEIYSTPKGKTWMNNYLDVACPEGESYGNLMQRVKNFIAELKNINHRQVAIVTHAGVIRIIKSIIEEQPIEKLFKDFKPEFGEIVYLNFQEK